MHHAHGFSLLELMIVVTIIGILSALAIPSYQIYTRRARFAEVISATEVYKTAVAIALQQGASPNELINGSSGIPNVPKITKNLASLTVQNGVITSIGTELVDHASYILSPNDDGSLWTISGTCVERGFCNA